MCSGYRYGVVSTSSVVWSQVRWFFLLRYIFHAINHEEQKESLWLSSMFILHMSTSMQYNGFAQKFTVYNSSVCTMIHFAQ